MNYSNRKYFWGTFFLILACQPMYTEDIKKEILTDEQNVDRVENVMKTSFAQIFANIINAIQHPELTAQYVAGCVQAVVNVIFEATKHKKIIDQEEVFDAIETMCQSIGDPEIAEEIIRLIRIEFAEKNMCVTKNV